MMETQAPPPPMPPLRPLYKQMSWSPDMERDEAWLRRKGNHKKGLKRSNSVTDDDLEELKGCIDLGFGFAPDSPDLEPRLSNTLPALEFYCAVNRQFTGRLSRSSSSSSIGCNSDSGSSTSTIFEQGGEDEAEAVGTSGGLLGSAVFQRTKLMIFGDSGVVLYKIHSLQRRII